MTTIAQRSDYSARMKTAERNLDEMGIALGFKEPYNRAKTVKSLMVPVHLKPTFIVLSEV